MNERSRRNHQSRRQSQLSGSSSLNCQYHQNNSRSIYQAHPADNYSSSNHRHPSTTTTTTTTNPYSSCDSEAEDDCKISICYSYLIAMLSSVLVVLGIYLSVTKFNVRFLFISLLGISIEAIGACVYCISNILASKSARRKQRVNSDELILNGVVNDENNMLNSIVDSNSNRQQQINTITHILSNRNLTNNTNDHDNEINSTAINNNTQLLKIDQAQSTDPQAQVLVNGEHSNQNQGEKSVALDESRSQQAAPPENQIGDLTRQDQVDHVTVCTAPHFSGIKSENSPVASHCQPSPGGTSNEECLSTTVLLTEDQLSSLPTDSARGHPSNRPTGSIMVDGSTIKTNQTSMFDDSSSHEDNRTINTSDNVPVSTNSSDQQTTPNLDTTTINDRRSREDQVVANNGQQGESSDLINLKPRERGAGLIVVDNSSEGQAAIRKTPQARNQQRAAHLRRTLVMGLGGEEELIEVDEADLDNMSVLPPSYESISTSTATVAPAATPLASDSPKQSN